MTRESLERKHIFTLVNIGKRSPLILNKHKYIYQGAISLATVTQIETEFCLVLACLLVKHTVYNLTK